MGAGAAVVVVGGTGFYGRYLVEDLCRATDASIVVAVRHRVQVERVWPSYPGRVSSVTVDHHDVAALAGLALAGHARFERFTPLVRGFSWLVGRAGDESGGFVLEMTGSRDDGVLTRAIGMTAVREGGRIPALLAAIAVEEILAGRLATPGIVPPDAWLDAATLRQRLGARGVVWWRRVGGDGSSWVQWDDAVDADLPSA